MRAQRLEYVGPLNPGLSILDVQVQIADRLDVIPESRIRVWGLDVEALEVSVPGGRERFAAGRVFVDFTVDEVPR